MENQLSAWWRKEQGDTSEIISTPSEIDGLIDELMTGPADHNVAQVYSLNRPLLASGYPDHELMIGVDRERQKGIIALMNPDEGNIFTVGDDGDSRDVAYFLAGHRMEYPPGIEIPLNLVRDAVKEFLATGGRTPRCVRWQTSDLW